MTTPNLYLSDNQTDTLRAIQTGKVNVAKKAKTILGLVALGLAKTDAGAPSLTPAGEAALRERLDARNARARREREAEKARREFDRASREAAALLTPEQTEAAFAEYRAKRGPGALIGSLAIGPDGKAYEAISWERLMSE